MSEQTTGAAPDDDPRVLVLQAVVDRVTSWQETATPEQLRAELDEALAEAGVDDVDEGTRERFVEHIHRDGRHASIRDILG